MRNLVSQFPGTRASLLAKLRTEEDELAWQEFLTIYQPVIYRIARKRGLQDADAQDLAQTVLVAVAGAIESWEQRDGVRFRNWLRKIASNAILKALTRGPKDRAQGGTEAIEQMNDHPESEEEIDRELKLEREREVYHRAAKVVRSEVNAQTWQIFQLAVVEGIPIDEVAQKFGKSVGAAYAARGRVMKRLQNAVERMQE